MPYLQYDMNELVYETEIDSQIQRTGIWLPRGMRVGDGRTESMGLSDTNDYI